MNFLTNSTNSFIKTIAIFVDSYANSFAFIALALFTINSLSNLDFFAGMANSDVIQFIQDGRVYSSFNLPNNIHASPGYPILISLASLITQFFSPFPEIIAARLISLSSVVISLIILYLLTKKNTTSMFGLVILCIAITHPWTFIMSVGDYSETLFTSIVMLSLFSIEIRKNISIGFILAATSFLVRNEGFLFFSSLSLFFFVPLAIESFKQKKILKTATIPKGFLIGLAIILSIALLTFIHNLNTFNVNPAFVELKYGNYFLFEIDDRKQDLPELRFLSTFPLFLIGKDTFYSSSSDFLYMPIGLTLILFPLLYLLRKNEILKIIALYIFLYFLIHILFPAFDLRYFYPIFYLFLLIMVHTIHICIDSIQNYFKNFASLFFIVTSLFLIATLYTNGKSNSTYQLVKTYYDSHVIAGKWIDELSAHSNKKLIILVSNLNNKLYFSRIDQPNGRNNDWQQFYEQDSNGNYHQSYYNEKSNTTLMLINAQNCFDTNCVPFENHLVNEETYFIHTNIDSSDIEKKLSENAVLIDWLSDTFSYAKLYKYSNPEIE